MKERPILFSAPMVRAILDGRKTQTRRAAKIEAVDIVRLMNKAKSLDGYDEPSGEFGVCSTHSRVIDRHARCPYGVIGDRLWVREAWRAHGEDRHESLASATSTCTGPEDVMFRATASEADYAIHRWRPGIHMPRWASRITLGVTEVRIQRLHEISEDDARAEGVERCDETGAYWGAEGRGVMPGNTSRFTHARDAFADLWRGINGPGSWEANPWVWAISFTVQGGGAA